MWICQLYILHTSLSCIHVKICRAAMAKKFQRYQWPYIPLVAVITSTRHHHKAPEGYTWAVEYTAGKNERRRLLVHRNRIARSREEIAERIFWFTRWQRSITQASPQEDFIVSTEDIFACQCSKKTLGSFAVVKPMSDDSEGGSTAIQNTLSKQFLWPIYASETRQ